MMDEKSMVKNAKLGDKKALELIIMKYSKKLYFACLSIVGNEDDAWDLSQEAFIRAIRSLKRFDENRPFYPYLYTIMRNLAYKHRKKNTLLPSIEIEYDDPEEMVIKKEEIERLRNGLLKLPPDKREILYLRYFEDLSYKDIAGALNISEGTVMSRLYNAKKKLFDMMEGK